jgi:hypothetical protein
VKSLLRILGFVFGCHHRQKSGVFTINKRTYQVCLKCGEEFDYSWARMCSVRSGAGRGPDVQQKNAGRAAEALI